MVPSKSVVLLLSLKVELGDPREDEDALFHSFRPLHCRNEGLLGPPSPFTGSGGARPEGRKRQGRKAGVVAPQTPPALSKAASVWAC